MLDSLSSGTLTPRALFLCIIPPLPRLSLPPSPHLFSPLSVDCSIDFFLCHFPFDPESHGFEFSAPIFLFHFKLCSSTYPPGMCWGPPSSVSKCLPWFLKHLYNSCFAVYQRTPTSVPISVPVLLTTFLHRNWGLPQLSTGSVVLHCVPDIWSATLWGCGSWLSLAENGPLWFQQVIVLVRLRRPTLFCGLWFQSVASSEPSHRLSLLGTVKWEGDQTCSLLCRPGGTSDYGPFLQLTGTVYSHGLHIAVPCIPARLHSFVPWEGSQWRMFTSSDQELEFLDYIWSS